ncbi:hypothetical protein O181_011547 [Austropuccinia psidii MF-1]|uniref:Uncharacterized protein n=1 Tax=Austropuccinia psidii MF-1 TaxID=1389203 RepID=A0A9Q3BUP8_9BASI|nr:hypothetical protein [Austropuccinia psidii MF-1]
MSLGTSLSPIDEAFPFSLRNIDPAFFSAKVKVKCFNFSKPGQFAHGCPSQVKPLFPVNNCLPNQYVPPIQFQAHYPIITPLVPLPFRSQFQPLPSSQRNADLYQPNYMVKKQARLKARFAEMGEEAQGVEVLHAEIDSVAREDNDLVCDTGTSHSLTGNRNSLYSFRWLTKPIPISVAINQPGRRSQVSGVASLLYPGLNSQNVIIRGVYFCPYATCTLISLTALARAGKVFVFDNNNDILFCDEYQMPILCAMIPDPLK